MSKLSNKIISTSVSLAMVFTLVAMPASGQTVSELQAQIAALLSQIQTLQAQLNNVQNSGGTAIAIGTFTRDLTVGDTGSDVSDLQKFLKNEGVDIYPEGLVTGYFGPLTKAAVTRYQNKYASEILAPVGLSSGTGYFGPSTRAHMNSRLAVTTPPPATTPPPTTPPPAGSPTPTPTPTSSGVAAGTVMASLDSGNPFGTTLVADSTSGDGAQVLAEVLRLRFEAGSLSSDAKVTSLRFKRSGVSADSDFANAYLYEGETRVSDTAAVSDNYFTFTNSNGLFSLSSGASRSISLRVDLANGTGSGKTFTFSVMAAGDVTVSGASVSGTYPLMGNEFRTATVSDLGKLTTGSVTPSAATNVDAGTSNYEVIRIPFTAADQDVQVSYLKLTMIGSANTDALQNLALYVDGSQVGSTVALMNSDRTVTFDLSGSPFTILSGATKQVSVRADVVKGSGRTFRFRINEAADVVARDMGYGVRIKLNQADVYTLVQAGGDTTISEGSLTITKASDSPSGNVALNATNVKVASYEWKAVGEDIKVSTVSLQVVDGATNSFTSIKNVKLLVDGSQVGTTVSSLNVDTTQAFSAGSSFVIPAGTTKTLDVYVDVSSPSGAADAMAANDTFFIRLITGASNAIRQSAGTTLNAPGSDQDANNLTVSSGNVTATKNSSVANMTVVESSQNMLLGSWLLTAPQEQGVDLTSLTLIDRNIGNGDDGGAAFGLGSAFDALMLKSGGTQYGQTVNSPSTASGTSQVFNLSTPLRLSAGQSTQVDLYGNVVSNANSNWTDGDGFRLSALTGTGLVTNSSVTLGSASNGQEITLSGGATLTLSNEVSPTMPNATWLVSGDTGVTLAAWKFSVDNTEDVNVTRIQLVEDGADDLPGNAKNLKLFVDGVQVGSTVPAFTDSGTNTALFENTSGMFTIPRNSNKTVVLRADLTDDTNASFSTDGSDLRLNLSTATSGSATATGNVSAKGSTSGQFVTLSASAVSKQSSNFKVVKTRPVFSLCETGGSGCSSVSDGETLVPGTVEVFRFQITAHSNEDVIFDGTGENIRFTVTSNPTAGNAGTFELFDASTDTSLGTQAAGATVDFNPTTTIPAGTSKTYYVKADLSSWTSAGNSFQLSIKNTSTDVSFNDNSSAAANISASNFVGWGLPIDGEILVKP